MGKVLGFVSNLMQNRPFQRRLLITTQKESKSNTVRNVYQLNQKYETQKKQIKTTARFGCLVQNLAWRCIRPVHKVEIETQLQCTKRSKWGKQLIHVQLEIG